MELDQALASLRIETFISIEIVLGMMIRLSRACGLKRHTFATRALNKGSGSREPAD